MGEILTSPSCLNLDFLLSLSLSPSLCLLVARERVIKARRNPCTKREINK
jgi:hypothetical protein